MFVIPLQCSVVPPLRRVPVGGCCFLRLSSDGSSSVVDSLSSGGSPSVVDTLSSDGSPSVVVSSSPGDSPSVVRSSSPGGCPSVVGSSSSGAGSAVECGDGVVCCVLSPSLVGNLQ